MPFDLSSNLFGAINPANTDLPSQLKRTLGDPRVLLSSGLAAFGSGAAAHLLNNREAPRMGETPSARRSRQLKNVLLAAATGGAVIPGAALGYHALDAAQPGSSPASKGLADAEEIGALGTAGGAIGSGFQKWRRSTPKYEQKVTDTINEMLGRGNVAHTPVTTAQIHGNAPLPGDLLNKSETIYERLAKNLGNKNISSLPRELPQPGLFESVPVQGGNWLSKLNPFRGVRYNSSGTLSGRLRGTLDSTTNRFIGRTNTPQEEAAALMRSIGASVPGDSLLSRINPLSAEQAGARNAPEGFSIGARGGALAALAAPAAIGGIEDMYNRYRDTTK